MLPFEAANSRTSFDRHHAHIYLSIVYKNPSIYEMKSFDPAEQSALPARHILLWKLTFALRSPSFP